MCADVGHVILSNYAGGGYIHSRRARVRTYLVLELSDVVYFPLNDYPEGLGRFVLTDVLPRVCGQAGRLSTHG